MTEARLLLVEDDESLREALVDILQLAQFDCVDVGEKTRQDIRHLYVQGIKPTWTPIKPVTSPFVVGRNTTA